MFVRMRVFMPMIVAVFMSVVGGLALNLHIASTATASCAHFVSLFQVEDRIGLAIA
jgi:hypothetical protein